MYIISHHPVKHQQVSREQVFAYVSRRSESDYIVVKGK